MGFYGCLNYVAATAFRIFEFYYFIKELHEEIVCTKPTCLSTFLYDHKKCFEEVKKFFIMHCSKKNK